MCALKTYRFLSTIFTPLIALALYARAAKGKELRTRLPEKWGRPERSAPAETRPPGKLLWLHAASVGEVNSILALIEELLARDEQLHILLTTVTVTSARLAQTKLPPRALHQFVPVDLAGPARRFLRYWKPDAAFLTESEIWPNLISEIKKSVPVYGIVNGRMSERSAKKWRYVPKAIESLLGGFHIFAQSTRDAERYRTLGASNVSFLGNLKFDAPPLPYDETEYQSLKKMIGSRPLWLAASTHPEEESQIRESIQPRLRTLFPDLLTIIVPRHAARGEALAASTAHAALRSRAQVISPDTEFYIADTMGELGLFYRLCRIVFIGGSLFAHGGQNMLEPARLGCACLWGGHVFNFEDAASMLLRYRAGIQCSDSGDVAAQLAGLLTHPEKATEIGSNAQRLMSGQSGVVTKIADMIIKAMQAAPAAI